MKNNIQTGKFVAIDVGSISLKASVLELSDKSARLLSTIEIEYEAPSVNRDDDSSSNVIVAALKQLKEKLPISKTTQVVSLYSNRELQIKILDLPDQMETDTLEQSLTWEARKLLAPAHKEAPFTFSYKIIRNPPMSVALCVIPTSILEKHMELYKLSGIKLNGIIPEVYANTSLLKMADITGLPAVSIVNIGYFGTHLQIYSAGELRFYRYIPSGMSEMTNPPTNSELEVYTQKIRFSFDYFRAISKLNQIDLLSFLGGGAACDTLLPYAQGYFAPTKITSLDVSSMIDISNVLSSSEAENTDAQDKHKELLRFIPSVGASLSAARKDSATTNLLARFRASKRLKSKQAILSQVPLYTIVGILLITFVVASIYKEKLAKEKTRLEGLIAQTDGEIERLKSSEEYLKESSLKDMQLSGKAGEIVNPLMDQVSQHILLANARILARKYKITIDEMLIKSELEAELINLESSSEESGSSTSSEKSEEDDLNPYLSSMYQIELNEQDLPYAMDGKVLILKGSANMQFNVADFANKLVQQKDLPPLKRVKSLVVRKAKRGYKFLLKGVLS